MKKNVLCTLCTIAALSFACFDSSAQTSSDLGSWCSVNMVKSWGQPYVMARIEHRSYHNMKDTECYFAVAGAGCRVTDWLSADMGYEFWKLPVSGNATVHKGTLGATASIRRDGLSAHLREKYELAFSGDGSPAGTLRSRIRVQYKSSSSPFTPYIMYEFFNGFRAQPWQRSLHYVGTEIRLAQHHSIDLFYMYHMYPKAGGVAGTHTLGVCYMLNL